MRKDTADRIKREKAENLAQKSEPRVDPPEVPCATCGSYHHRTFQHGDVWPESSEIGIDPAVIGDDSKSYQPLGHETYASQIMFDPAVPTEELVAELERRRNEASELYRPIGGSSIYRSKYPWYKRAWRAIRNAFRRGEY